MAEHDGTPHVHGTMDVAEHEQTFAAFVHFWVYLAAVAIGILVFLALFNS